MKVEDVLIALSLDYNIKNRFNYYNMVADIDRDRSSMLTMGVIIGRAAG
jgi:hypothetical protein